MGRERMDHHIQSPEITSNRVTAHKDTELSFYAHCNSHRCPQHLWSKTTNVMVPCRSRRSLDWKCLNKHRQQTASHTAKKGQNVSAAPFHVPWPYNCQADHLRPVGRVVQPRTWEVSQHHQEWPALSYHNLWPFLIGIQRGFTSYGLRKQTYILESW